MPTYEEALTDVYQNGQLRPDRTGTGTVSKFLTTISYDLADGFPLITTKKVHFKSVIGELLWFLRGDTNIAWLKERGISIWDEWADENGDLGPVYGAQWRAWQTAEGKTVDQIEQLITGLKENPFGRRHILSAWNVGQLKEMALPPCHVFTQLYVDNDGRLSLHLYQRSADMFLGVPFNIASYAALLMLIARETGYELGTLYWTGGDSHIYTNHIRQVETQMQREPRNFPTLHIADIPIEELDIEDFTLEDYNPHPPLRGEVAV